MSRTKTAKYAEKGEIDTAGVEVKEAWGDGPTVQNINSRYGRQDSLIKEESDESDSHHEA